MANKKKTTGKKTVVVKDLKKTKKELAEEKLKGVAGGALPSSLYVKSTKPISRSTCTSTGDEVDDL